MEYAAGVDFGGSSAKIGLVGRDGSVLGKDVVRIDPAADFEGILRDVAGGLGALMSRRGREDRLIVTGIDMPGFIDKRGGVVVSGSENIPCFQGRSPQEYLEKTFGVPAFSENDATSAAAGELVFGAGKRFSSFVLITLGTAIGGGLVLGGSVYRGSRGFAGEVGHLVVVADGVACNCGSRGCFEQYASGTAIVRVYREKLRKRGCDDPTVTPKTVADRARTGDPQARQVMEEAARYIAQAMGSILNLLDLDACLIGGGVAEAGEILLEPVRQLLPDYCWPDIGKGVEVLRAELGNDAGIMGAAAQALERLDG